MFFAKLRLQPVLAATIVGAVSVMISGLMANYHDGHDGIVFGLVFFLCNAIAFWNTRNQGWRSVLMVGAVSASLLLVTMAASFPRLSDQVLRSHVIHGLTAGWQLGLPLLIPIAFFSLLAMAIASVARYTMGRRVIGAAMSVLAAGLVVFGMIAYARTLDPKASIEFPPPLGISTDELLQSAEAVPPEWKVYPAAEGRDVPTATELRDIAYGPHGWRNQLNLFRPADVDAPIPVVVYIHGGGWVIGDKDEVHQTPWVHALLRNGIAIAPINYRLAPSQCEGGDSNGVPFPAQIQDCYAAIRFLRANAVKYNLDPGKIAVMGHSAGGHLAALVGLASDVKEFNNEGWNLEIDHRVKAALSLAGPTDLRILDSQAKFSLQTLNQPNWEYRGSTTDFDSVVGMLLGGPLRDNIEKAVAASPVSYVSSDDPPVLLMNGFRDAIVPPHQAELLHCKLRAAGVESELHLVPGAGHSLAACPGTSTPIVQFLQKHLK